MGITGCEPNKYTYLFTLFFSFLIEQTSNTHIGRVTPTSAQLFTHFFYTVRAVQKLVSSIALLILAGRLFIVYNILTVGQLEEYK